MTGVELKYNIFN